MKKEKQSRILYFDLIRILSCIMIVFMHAQKDGVGTPGWLLAGSGYIEAAGIGLFFMISGALVLNSRIEDESSVAPFLWHRMKRVCVPLFFWYLIYTFTQRIDFEYTGRGVLWFLWTIGGLYILSPILIRWLRHAGDKEVLFYIGVWCISLLFPVANLLIPLLTTDTSWVYYFHGYVGYYVLGYYLAHRMKQLSRLHYSILGIVFFIISLCAPLVILFMDIEIDFFQFFWYLSLPVVLQCVVWFLCIQRKEPSLQAMPMKVKSVIRWISAQTFGIYLMHILIMRGWLWKTELIQSLHSVNHMVVCAVVTFCIAMVLTDLIRRIPYLRMIVGG